MPLSVLPKVISQIEGNDQQFAVYRLLKSMPALCNNVSEHKFSDGPTNKRQKVGLVQTWIGSNNSVGSLRKDEGFCQKAKDKRCSYLIVP